MEDHINARLERIEATLNRIDVTLAKQHVSLETHIKRTDLLEERLEPISAHVAIVGAIGKILIGSGGVVGLVMLGVQIYRLVAGV